MMNTEIQPTILIGREKILSTIQGYLLGKDIHLLTLIGIAGVGKTRVATEVARKLESDFDRIVYIDLSTMTNLKQFLPTVALKCEVLESTAGSLAERLSRRIGSQKYLIILDNCDHVLDAMQDLDDLLINCPNLKILATSREHLQLNWELVMVIPPLELPDKMTYPALDVLAQIPAVAFFLQKARVNDHTFSLSEDNAKSIVDICIRLDGLPLAIELVASLVSQLGLKMISERLSHILNFSVFGRRDLPARHKALRSAIDWTFNFLDSQEKCLFRRLAVFNVEWTLSTAEKICSGDGLKSEDIQRLLESLVRRSLVWTQEVQPHEMRYGFPVVIREYALDKLKEAGEENNLRHRHRGWFSEWLRQGEPNLFNYEVVQWFDQIELEYGNIRAALDWSSAVGKADRGMVMYGALHRFWYARSHFMDGMTFGVKLLKFAPEHNLNRIKTLIDTLNSCQHLGDWDKSKTLTEELYSLSKELNDIPGLVWALVNLGKHSGLVSDHRRAFLQYEEAVNIGRAAPEDRHPALMIALGELGLYECRYGDIHRAVKFTEEAHKIANENKDYYWETIVTAYLGRIYTVRGDSNHAEALLSYALSSSLKIAGVKLTSFILELLAELTWIKKDYLRAIRMFGVSEELMERVVVTRIIMDPLYEKCISEIKMAYGETVIKESRAHVKHLSLKEASTWALMPILKLDSAQKEKTSSSATSLSRRELEIASLVAEGLSNRQIAKKLNISVGTAGIHISHILDKLTIDSRVQIASWYIRHHDMGKSQ